MTGDRLRIVIRWGRIVVRRGRKSILLLDPVEARELGADLVLAAESLTSTAPLVSSDAGVPW